MNMKNLYRVLLLLFFLTIPVLKGLAQKFEIDTLQYYGNTRDYINLVILGDGYTQTQLKKYGKDAQAFSNYLFNQVPFNSYKRYFNVFAIRVPSAEAGVKHPNNAPDCYAQNFPAANPDNYFGTTFDYGGIHRLVVPTYHNKIALVLAENMPEFDQVVVLVNTPEYGGSGGRYATVTLNPASNEIALHEMGHSFGGLADEYWAGENYAMEKPNLTQESDSSRIKWKNWLTPQTGIGIHPHWGQLWYRPTKEACLMELLKRKFCAVCSEAIIERIHTLLSPIGNAAPGSPPPLFTTSQTPDFYVLLKNIKTNPNTLKTTWQFNGLPVPSKEDSIQIVTKSLQVGLNTLSATVADTSTQTRSEEHRTQHRYTVNWTIEHSIVLPVSLKFFHAAAHPARIDLAWATASEINNDRFEIEKSMNGWDWKVLGTLPAKGNSPMGQTYFFSDYAATDLYPTLYYRLRQYDVNGHSEYSSVRAIGMKAQAPRVRLLGNPVAEQLQIEVLGQADLALTLEIYNLDGERVLALPLTKYPATGMIPVPVAHLVPGVYVYSLLQDTKVLDTNRFLKIKH